jgi:hypothetical protein
MPRFERLVRDFCGTPVVVLLRCHGRWFAAAGFEAERYCVRQFELGEQKLSFPCLLGEVSKFVDRRKII